MTGSQTILGIETSCDETAVSLVRFEAGGQKIEVLENLVTSQIPIHQKYGGVVPEVAARSHVPETVALLTQIVGQRKAEGFDAIAVTRGPGLPTALGVGVEAARVLAFMSGKPLIGVNHLEAHLASAWLNAENRQAWKFPLLALVVSGGHTELVILRDFCDYQVIGQTRDDAAGEAFDKSAKLMHLPYPGGPEIARAALDGDPQAFKLPRPMLDDPSFDFSFSGLKTAVRRIWEELRMQNAELRNPPQFSILNSEFLIPNLAASLQQAIVEVLVEKTLRAAYAHAVNGILLVGGVSANAELRRQLGERIAEELPGVAFMPSDRAYITDNAAMVAAAGYWRLLKGERHDWQTLDIAPDLSL